MGEKELALGLINKFKMIKNPGIVEFSSIPLKFRIHQALRRYFKTITPRYMNDVRAHYISENKCTGYSNAYLEVIGSIARVLDIHIYMKEILEGDNLIPVKRLVVIGNKTEASIAMYLCKYLYIMEERIYNNIKHKRPKEVSAQTYRFNMRHRFFMPIYKILNDLHYFNLKEKTLNPTLLEKKRYFVLQFMLKNFIFDFKEKNINPQYAEHPNTILDQFKVKTGKWKRNHLLWTRDIKR